MGKQIEERNPPPAQGADGFAVGRPVGGAVLGHKPPDFQGRTKFFQLAAHPSSWDLVATTEGGRVVPTLKRLVTQPGVNWTPAPEAGQAASHAELEAKARTKLGMTVLTDVQEYLVEHEGVQPGFFLKWERVRVYPDGFFEIAMDHDGYDLWRWSLVESGRIAKPRESILSQLRSRLQKARQRATRTPHLAQAQEAIAVADARLVLLDEAIAALRGKGQESRPKPLGKASTGKAPGAPKPPPDEEEAA